MRRFMGGLVLAAALAGAPSAQAWAGYVVSGGFTGGGAGQARIAALQQQQQQTVQTHQTTIADLEARVTALESAGGANFVPVGIAGSGGAYLYCPASNPVMVACWTKQADRDYRAGNTSVFNGRGRCGNGGYGTFALCK